MFPLSPKHKKCKRHHKLPHCLRQERTQAAIVTGCLRTTSWLCPPRPLLCLSPFSSPLLLCLPLPTLHCLSSHFLTTRSATSFSSLSAVPLHLFLSTHPHLFPSLPNCHHYRTARAPKRCVIQKSLFREAAGPQITGPEGSFLRVWPCGKKGAAGDGLECKKSHRASSGAQLL